MRVWGWAHLRQVPVPGMSAVEGRTPLDTRRTCQKQMERQSIGTVPIRHICLMHTKKAIHKIVGTHEHVRGTRVARFQGSGCPVRHVRLRFAGVVDGLTFHSAPHGVSRPASSPGPLSRRPIHETLPN